MALFDTLNRWEFWLTGAVCLIGFVGANPLWIVPASIGLWSAEFESLTAQWSRSSATPSARWRFCGSVLSSYTRALLATSIAFALGFAIGLVGR